MVQGYLQTLYKIKQGYYRYKIIHSGNGVGHTENSVKVEITVQS